ncbi:MAG: hypothetical protein RLO12_21750 [Fulvivirga sp.]
MKYLIITAQIAAILYLFLDLFDVVNMPELRVAAYGVIIFSLVFTLVIASQKYKA